MGRTHRQGLRTLKRIGDPLRLSAVLLASRVAQFDGKISGLFLTHEHRHVSIADVLPDRLPALAQRELAARRRRAEIGLRDAERESVPYGAGDKGAADLLGPILRIDPDGRDPG